MPSFGSLARLQAAELLYPVSLFPSLELTFKHALTHEVAYGSLLQERRKALHARIVEAIEARYADRLEEHVDRLAQHAVAGKSGNRRSAISARQATGRACAPRNREAGACFEQALDVLRRLPESRGNLEWAVDLRLDLRQAQMPLGDSDRVPGDRLAKPKHTPKPWATDRIGRVAVVLANSLWWYAEYDQAIEAGLRGLAAADAHGDVTLQIEANQVARAMQLSGRGDFRRSAARLRRNVAALAGRPPTATPRYGRVSCGRRGRFLAWCLGQLGEFEAATAVG